MGLGTHGSKLPIMEGKVCIRPKLRVNVIVRVSITLMIMVALRVRVSRLMITGRVRLRLGCELAIGITR